MKSQRYQTLKTQGQHYPYSDLTQRIIGCAIKVHKTLGPGFKESAYENASICELAKSGKKYEHQKSVSISYKGTNLGRHRLDLLIENEIIVELKTAKNLNAGHAKIF